MGEHHGSLEARTTVLDVLFGQRGAAAPTAVPTGFDSRNDQLAGGPPAREGNDPRGNGGRACAARPVRQAVRRYRRLPGGEEGDRKLGAHDRIRSRAAGDREAASGRCEAFDHHAKGHRGLSGQAAPRRLQQSDDQHGCWSTASGAQAIQTMASARGRREDADRSWWSSRRPRAHARRNRSASSRLLPAIRSGSTCTARPFWPRTPRCEEWR